MADELGLNGKERNEFRSFVIVGFALVLVFSVFLPIFSSSSEAVSTSDQQQRIDDLPEKDSGDPGLKGWMADVKEVQTEEIWHSEVGDPYAGPFETNKTTVYLNLTAHGDPTEIVQPFDWMFSMDTSGSMEGALEDSVNGAKHFVELVEANVSGCRGATIDFGDWEELVNNRHFTEDYEAIKSDLDSLEVPGDTGQGTDFGPPLQKALDEFSYYGNTSRSWFHLFLTDGKSNTGDFWNLVEQHADNDIPIYTIGFGGIDKTTLEDMAEMTGGEFHEAEDPSDLDKVFEAIFDEITSLDKTAVEAPPTNEPMIQEVLPPHLEYIEGSMEVETTPQELEIDMNVREEEGKTIFELKPEREGSAKLNIDDEIHLSYDVRASKYSHDLPITAYDGNGNPESKVKYYNLSSDSVDTIYTPGPKLAVHGYPEPILGTKRPHGFEVGQPVNF
ncbi:MAG: vWA domain-containing protein, partial [Candidatus Natronoplasma sp.]